MVTQRPQAIRRAGLIDRAATGLLALLWCSAALAEGAPPEPADSSTKPAASAPVEGSAAGEPAAEPNGPPSDPSDPDAAPNDPPANQAPSTVDRAPTEPEPTAKAGRRGRARASRAAARRPAGEGTDLPVALLHSPRSVTPAHEPFRIEAEILNPHLVARAWLVFRTPLSRTFRQVEFLRSTPGPYAAEVDEAYVVPPYLEYTIELELREGRRVTLFGTRQAPHRVQIPADRIDVVERALDARVEGRRNVFSAGADYVSFGTSEAELRSANGQRSQTTVGDYYYRVEAGYTHRLLGWIPEFGIRAGVLRGRAPVPVRDLSAGQEEDERFDVGLNYGMPWLRFRVADILHADGSMLISVNELGFQVGAGTTIHIGDPYGSKLSVGVEGVQEFGTRFFTQVDIQAHERVRVAPIIEVTNAPSADRVGLRVLGEIAVNVGYGFTVTGRGGYQARSFTSGGPSAGGSLAYAF